VGSAKTSAALSSVALLVRVALPSGALRHRNPAVCDDREFINNAQCSPTTSTPRRKDLPTAHLSFFFSSNCCTIGRKNFR
jgi:hypothetical protein